MTLVVGSKGQIVISKEIRDKIGIKPGWIALERLTGDHVEVYFVPPEHRKSLKSSLLPHIKKHIAQGKEWNEVRDNVWDKAARKKISEGKQVK